MQVDLSEKTVQRIQQAMARGGYHTLDDMLLKLVDGYLKKLDFQQSLAESQRTRLPDPPVLDECISPPVDLPYPKGVRLHVRHGRPRLPDPLVEEP